MNKTELYPTHEADKFFLKRADLIQSNFPDERRLDAKELLLATELLASWREPERQMIMGNCDISIYRTTKRPEERNLNESIFRSPLEERLTKEARKAYLAYGEVPLIDEYDAKSNIYYVQFTYPSDTADENIHGKTYMREGIFLRYVPYTGEPYSNEDFDLYTGEDDMGRKVPLIDLLRQTTQDPDIEKRLVTQSRFCTIRPFQISESDDRKREAILINGNPYHFMIRNQYPQLGFALASQQFLMDSKNSHQESPLIITGQLHSKLSDKILKYQDVTMPFTLATEFLSTRPESINIDRSKPDIAKYVYSHPGYFLNVPAMVEVLDALITKNKISESIVNQHLNFDTPWEVAKERKSMMDWGKIGNLFNTTGPIPDSNITGEDLREMLNIYVPDGPSLRIMSENVFSNGVDHMVYSAGVVEK